MNCHHNNTTGVTLVWAVAGMLQLNVLCLSADEVTARGQHKNERMLKQKMALVERMLFQSPLGAQAKQRPSELSAETFAAWESARLAYEKALARLQENHNDRANEELDFALSFYRQASALHRGSGKESENLAGVLSDLRNRIDGYQDSLATIAKEKKITLSESMDEQKISETLTTAESLDQQGDVQSAVQLLQALQASLESELVRIRSGETVVTHLQIDNKEDALEYEMRRNTSNDKLLGVLFRNTSLTDTKRRVFSRYLQQSREAGIQAMQYREAGDFEAALNMLESSTELQTKALRIFGITL